MGAECVESHCLSRSVEGARGEPPGDRRVEDLWVRGNSRFTLAPCRLRGRWRQPWLNSSQMLGGYTIIADIKKGEMTAVAE